MIKILLIVSAKLRVVLDLLSEPLRMLRALRILGVIVQILTVVVHHLLSVELVMRVRNLTDEVANILSSLTGPVTDVSGCITSPVYSISSSSRDGVADVASSLPNSICSILET